MERINIYIDGPNLLGAVSEIEQRRVWVDPVLLSRRLVQPSTQAIQTIYYAETPYPSNLIGPETFRRQQSFFGHIYKYKQNKEIHHIEGNYRITTERVPQDIVSALSPNIQKVVSSISWKRPREKGGDVGLAVRLVRDAFQNKFDRALLVSEDQDFASAIKVINSDIKVDIAYVNNSHRNARALRNLCPHAGFVQITRADIKACIVPTPDEKG